MKKFVCLTLAVLMLISACAMAESAGATDVSASDINQAMQKNYMNSLETRGSYTETGSSFLPGGTSSGYKAAYQLKDGAMSYSIEHSDGYSEAYLGGDNLYISSESGDFALIMYGATIGEYLSEKVFVNGWIDEEEDVPGREITLEKDGDASIYRIYAPLTGQYMTAGYEEWGADENDFTEQIFILDKDGYLTYCELRLVTAEGEKNVVSTFNIEYETGVEAPEFATSLMGDGETVKITISPALNQRGLDTVEYLVPKDAPVVVSTDNLLSQTPDMSETLSYNAFYATDEITLYAASVDSDESDSGFNQA